MNIFPSQGAFPDTKKHFPILDGLRGVAAIIVVFFHIFEVFSNGDHTKQLVNHGYLAVDFFFLLSGYVIAHAYDDRWGKMTLKDFFKRRLVRLHPMIIVGMLIGAVCFYFQASPMFPPIAGTPVWKMLLVMVIGFTLLPVPMSLDIRGWGEMHPLNGPAWSLFYEYIANIFYALFLKKVSNTVLSFLVLIAAAVLIHFALTNPNGDVIGGWSLNAEQMRIGFTRLSFPFLAGMLLRRVVKPGKINDAFFISGLLLTMALVVPRVGDSETLWINGLYDSLVIILLFPVIVFVGASGDISSDSGKKICSFLGDISYPIYIIHYPIVYIFYGWVSRNSLEVQDALPVGFGVFVLILAVSYAGLKFYDVPVREWLTQKFIRRKS